jgi:lipopolysaccharide/colanic/teichoic acid biosynthesis glycosyltransferase
MRGAERTPKNQLQDFQLDFTSNVCANMSTTFPSTDEPTFVTENTDPLGHSSFGKGNTHEAVWAIFNENCKQHWSQKVYAESPDSGWITRVSKRDSSRLLGTKRILDILGAFLGILVLGPVMLVGMLLIWLEDGGPVIFRQERVGLNGKRFTLLKIRTMVKDADSRLTEVLALNQHSDQRTFKAKSDPRILRYGRLLRKYSIDEFPQLLNVLCGQMSLVGPRPSLAREVVLYQPGDYVRLTVKPGLTCYWQIAGRGNVPFEEQLELDKKYIRERSALTDIVIIVKTFPSLIRANGAH